MKITDRSLLTFSNLVNLEWQFTKLKKGDNEKYPQINEKLKPESFIREDADGNFKRYIYMGEDVKENEFTPEEKELGVDQMRRKAGVAMQYLDISARSHI